ncbi:MAG: hypothetical protein L6R39_004226, partial [Caloplaca ligustica]
MSKAVKLMGATYEEDFSPKASVLVCNKVVLGHEKLRHAQHWHVPAVTADWLWDCIRCGEMKSFEPYLAQPYSAERPPGEKESQKQPLGRTGSNAKFGQRPIGEQAQGNDSLNKRMGGLDGRGLDPTKGTTTMQNEPDNTNANDLNHLGQPTTHASLPLQKITPNSSPPKPSISSKPTTTTDTDPPAPLKHPCQDPALSSAISSLLTHHQNARSLASSKPTIATTQNPPPPRLRRKRQLLGRAPSNASNLSRASSVDTVNTDGVGTPVELTRSASMISNKTNSIKNNATTTLAAAAADDDNSTFDPLATYRDEDDAALMESHDHLQMTQLGYEDPDALAWREK